MVNCTLNKRTVIFAGHYGSGKTNVAANYALMLKEKGFDTAIADLDIVNPYFRTKDAQSIFSKNNIKLISSEYAGSNVDLPALPAEAYALFDNKDIKAVIDLGGDDRGALAMGRYSDLVKNENNYEMLFVLNMYRPLTRTVEDAISVMREIEEASKIKFTGIVNNSNIGDETTKEHIISSRKFAEEISEITKIPLTMTTVKKELFEELNKKIENLVPIKLYIKQSWSKEI